MLQDRATSEANVARFVERSVRERMVWGLVSKSGDWAFCPSHEEKNADVLVFWSDRAYAARHVKEGWSEYEPKSIGLDQFMARYLKVMHEDGLRVGPNWDAHLCGVEMSALDLASQLDAEEQRANQRPDGTSAKAPPSNPSQGAAVPHP